MGTDIENLVLANAVKNRKLHVVQIELTSICNWKCIHCYIPSNKKATISLESLKKLLAKLRVLGVFEITYTGGEIFLLHNIIDIIRYTRELGFRVTLYSNISLLTESIVAGIAKLNVSLVGCTLFSMSEKIHDAITQTPGSLKCVLKSLQLLNKYHIDVEVKAGILQVNKDEGSDIERYCKKMGFVYTPYYDINWKSDGDIEPEKYRVSKKDMIELYRKEKQKYGEVLYNRDKDEYACRDLRHTLSIQSNGEINPCVRFFYPLGNINTDDIIDIWNNSKILIEFQNIKWGDLSKCATCDLCCYCKRCPGVAYMENADAYSASVLYCSLADSKSIAYERKYKKIFL